jgi:hypothetical protein
MMLIYRANDSEQNDRAEHNADNYWPKVSGGKDTIENSAKHLAEKIAAKKQYQKRANEQCGYHGSNSLMRKARDSEHDKDCCNSADVQQFSESFVEDRKHQHHRREYPDHAIHSLLPINIKPLLANVNRT